MTATVDHETETEDQHEHVSDWVYIKVAIILAVLTAIEVFTHFESVHQASDTVIIITLTLLMIIKFYFVVAYFMHLKYDNPIFTKMLVSGMVIAYPVYGIFAFSAGWLPDWNLFVKIALLAVPPIVLSFWLLFNDGPTGEHDKHADAH